METYLVIIITFEVW